MFAFILFFFERKGEREREKERKIIHCGTFT
jgi:hypothetical protein